MIFTGERMILNRMRKETEVEHLCRYYMAQKYVHGKNVLDAACGSGYGTGILAETAKYVTGMDISEEAVLDARTNFGKDNTNFVIGSVEKLPFKDNSFDVVVSFETIEHVNGEIQDSFLKEIKRVLKNDGILIMSTPNKKTFTDERSGIASQYHVKEFYVNDFEFFLHQCFKNVIMKKQFYAMSACIIDEISDKAMTEGFKDESLYVIAIASNTNIDGILRESFLYRYPVQYEKNNDYTQVFYSETEEYLEENSQIVEINNFESTQTVNVKLDGISARYLRIDPVKGGSKIKLNNINIKLMSGEQIDSIIPYYTNEFEKIKDASIFVADPQYCFDLGKVREIDEITIKFEMAQIEDSYLQQKFSKLASLTENTFRNGLIYFDYGKGFAQENSIQIKGIKVGDNVYRYEFDSVLDTDVKKLRLDPVENRICRICKYESNLGEPEIPQLRELETKNIIVSYDPQIIWNIPVDNNKVHFEVYVEIDKYENVKLVIEDYWRIVQ